MLYEAKIYQMNVEGHLFWVAQSNALKGCVGQGESSDEAIRELEENEKVWLETAEEFNIPIPPRVAKKEKVYSGKVSLRMSPYVHQNAVELSESLGISLNQFINDGLIEYTERVRSVPRRHLPQDNPETISNIIKYQPSKKKMSVMYREELEEL